MGIYWTTIFNTRTIDLLPVEDKTARKIKVHGIKTC